MLGVPQKIGLTTLVDKGGRGGGGYHTMDWNDCHQVTLAKLLPNESATIVPKTGTIASEFHLGRIEPRTQIIAHN